MRVSVIIATFNRAALLDECLDHLGRQRFIDGDEVLVVDNGSTDSTPAVIARHRRSFCVPLRHLEERSPGKSAALARALAIADGEILTFTDDDVNVGDEWLAEVRSAMANGEVALIGGPVAPRWERRAPWWLRLGQRDGCWRLAAPLALLDYGPEPLDLGPRTAIGANLAVRHDVIRRVGGFDTHLGKLRGTLLSGEDHDLCRRVQAAGFRTMYWPSAVVHHWVPASRVRVRYVLRWFFWSGVTNAFLDQAAGQRTPALFGVPRYLIRRFFGGIAGALACAVRGSVSAAMERAIDASFAAGYAARCWGLVRIGLRPPMTTGEVA
jgi:glucosyl-dolichyl phosphate glucuronosyltransferase